MLLHIPQVLDATQLAYFRQRLAEATWSDGRITAGHQSAQTKHNLQLDEAEPVARELSQLVLTALAGHAMFFAGALPARIFPPLFNSYRGGQSFGFHVDNAVRYDRSTQPATAVRTDLSATLFLAEPDDYDGGDLVIEDSFGTHAAKLPAGDMLLYPGSSLHKVEPVTRGARLASFFWIQSMVRDDSQRRLLYDLDVSIQALTQQAADADALLRLTGIYHNLLRCWADV
jgi:PKHD-type hydroxylase